MFFVFVSVFFFFSFVHFLIFLDMLNVKLCDICITDLRLQLILLLFFLVKALL